MKYKVKFYDDIDDKALVFAVIVSYYQNHLVMCKHKERNTLEIPGGHREHNEDIMDAAKRELYEETGATDYTIKPVCIYSVINVDPNTGCEIETFGKLFYADIKSFRSTLEYEIDHIELWDECPTNLTYPDIQPHLMKKVKEFLKLNK